jgi:hypothetical protein
MSPNTHRVLVYTGGYRPDYPARDIQLVQELRERGNEVTYTIGGPGISDIPHPKEVASDPRFASVQAHWVNNVFEMVKLLTSTDVFVVGVWAKTNQRLVTLAKSMGVVTLQHDNVPRIDVRYTGADWICESSLFVAEERKRRAHAQERKIVVTGSTMIDLVRSQEVEAITKASFCEKYRLDPSKKIAVWMPSAPQVQNGWHQASYTQICEIIQKSAGHSLIIKAHPNDYLKRKSPSFFQGKHTWQVLAPTAVVLEPEDAYQCYKVCDVGISNSSSVSLEFPLFSKPFVYVDIDKSPVLAMHRPSWWWGDLPSPSFIGMITSADELSAVLDESQYEISDDAAYQAHVAKYFYQADGLAYQRIADVIERAVEESHTSSVAVRLIRGSSWMARQRMASFGHYLVNPRRAMARFRR